MSVRDCLAASMGRTDEAPNVALAIEIADSLDAAAIAELFGIVRTGVTALQGDAIKVIYETAEREPALIAPFDSELINLLHSCNNRLTWGAMHALALVAPISANSMQPRIAEIVAAVQAGSVITQDWGIRALAELAIANPAANDATRTFLAEFANSCRSKDLPKHAESMASAFSGSNNDAAELLEVLQQRLPEMTPPQATRLRRLIKSSHLRSS